MLKLSACANTWNINYSSHAFHTFGLNQSDNIRHPFLRSMKHPTQGWEVHPGWSPRAWCSMVQQIPHFPPAIHFTGGETYHEMLARSYLIIHLRLLVSSFYCTMAIVASYLSIVMQNMMIFSITIAGWWFSVLPLWKMTDWKSVGMMKFPIYRKITFMFQSTNQNRKYPWLPSWLEVPKWG